MNQGAIQFNHVLHPPLPNANTLVLKSIIGHLKTGANQGGTLDKLSQKIKGTIKLPISLQTVNLKYKPNN